MPKIVILTSEGGNGHMAACAILKDTFPSYDITLVYPIYDIFHKVFDGEKLFYGKFLQMSWLRAANFIIRYPGQLFFKMNRHAFQKRIYSYLEKEKPDILISVIPMLNYPAAMAAQEHNTPFLVITLDADLTLWLIDMERCKNHNFIMTVQAKTPRIEQQLADKKISLTRVHEVGSPLRTEFFEPKDRESIIKEWGIPDNKKVALLIRGGTGSTKLVDYVKSLVKLDKPLHLLVCIGKNTKLIKKLNSIKTGVVSFSIIPFTQKIPDLMAISDLLITQPSPNVCNEAIHMKLPILIDMTSPCIFWEEATIDWIKLYGNGAVFKNIKQLNTLVATSLDKKETLKEQALKTDIRFNSEIYKIVNAQL